MREKSVFNRILALVAIVATVVLVLFSTEFLSEHLNHHCQDHAHCPVCAVMDQAEENLRTIGSSLILAVVSAMVVFAVAETKANFEYQSVQTTLVSQKVRIDD
jgi:hypothetical protein